MLRNLFHSTVQIPDYALRSENLLAIQFQNHSQYAVRSRVLRAHIDNELVRIEKCFLVILKFQVGGPVDSLPALDPQVDLYPLIVLLNNAVVLTQRVPLPAIRQ